MASLRRLAKDHAALQSMPPPNYLFPDTEDGSSWSDDLTQLVVLVTGADSTPYAQGLWRLHLKMPNDYPKNPPKATFKTRIYHPNVDEKTGAVCLETLKRDWDPKLTLKDILVTISCLLIQPNPDSALNAAAGALIQDNYDAFSTQAQLMTKIHAPIPRHLSNAVQEAKQRGEEVEQEASSSSTAQDQPGADDTKENDLKKSSEPSTCPPSRSQSRVREKRPLSELPTPEEADMASLGDAISEPKRKSPRTARLDASISSTTPTPLDESDKVSRRANVEQINIATTEQPRTLYPSPASRPAAPRKGSGATARRVVARVGIRRL